MSGRVNRSLGAALASGARPYILFLIVLLAALPLLNLIVPRSSPFYLPDFAIKLIGKWMCFAILALAIDLVWGYVGILSLGHGAFFTLGGYAMGMYMMRAIGDRGVYKNPVLPDFMVFLNWKELPWYWFGFDNFLFAILMVVLVPGLLAFVFGWLAFRSRITGVYLSIITQAMTFALMLAFFRNDMGFGGNNGLTDFKDILGFNLHTDQTRAGLYWASLVALILTFLLCRFLVRSKLGRVLTAVRDAESRVRFIGYSVTNYKLFAFTLSAMIAGVAGALYVPQVGIINPSEFSPAASIEAVIWVAVGGRGSLVGAILGAFVVNGGKSWLTSYAPEFWLFILGGIFVAVTLFLPRGLVGIFGKKGNGARVSKPSIANFSAMLGTPPAPKGAKAMTKPAEPVLYLDDVTVSFDGFRALNSLSFVVEPGELRTIIGPNGAGKTTMMDVITGKTRPDKGSAFFKGVHDLTKLSEEAIANLGIGRKFQRPTVFDNHTVFENLELALKADRRAFRTLFARLAGAQKERIEAVMEQIGLSARARDLAGALSHGQRQWLEIGMLLMQDPELLLVDEPVAGMTDHETEQTAALLKQIAGKHSVVVVEHDMEFVRALATKVTVLHEGSVLSEGTVDHVQNDPKVIEVYLGR